MMLFKKIAYTAVAITLLSVTTQASEKVSTTLWGSDGLVNKEFKTKVVDKLGSIDYEDASVSENIQDAYFEKYREKTLDNLGFYTVTDPKVMRKLLLANPRYGAFSPFNLLIYKKQTEDKTWYGKLTPEAIIDIIGEKDSQRIDAYKKMHTKMDALIQKEMHPKYSKQINYNSVAEKPLLEMVKTIDRSKPLDDVIDDFTDTHDDAFENAEFIIAGFYNFKEVYDDAKLPFDKYDAYWINILCHFTFSNSIFNHGDPQAGVFAPCSVYFYIEKGSNKLHVGMSRVENWAHMTGVTDPVKLKSMQEMDEKLIKVFKKLGFTEEGDKASAPAAKAAEALAAKKPVAASTIKHGAKYEIGKETATVPTYLIAPAFSVKDVTDKLKSNGFDILATTEVIPNETVISVSNDELKKLQGFDSVINVLVNDNAHEVRLQNPDYIARAYLGKKYHKGMLDNTIKSFQTALGELYTSEESMKTGDIAGYHFMIGMPYVDDIVEVGSGKDLTQKVKNNDSVVYMLTLPDGTTLVGHKLSKRTSKFLKKLGVTQNAAILPYTVLIRGDKAVMLDPKYYLALSLPGLSMGEFMKIATIPDAIKKDIAKVYK